MGPNASRRPTKRQRLSVDVPPLIKVNESEPKKKVKDRAWTPSKSDMDVQKQDVIETRSHDAKRNVNKRKDLQKNKPKGKRRNIQRKSGPIQRKPGPIQSKSGPTQRKSGP